MATAYSLAGLLSSSQVGAFVDNQGNPIAGQIVTLLETDGATPAPCWTTPQMTAAAPNSFPVGHAGQFQVWVTPGTYQPLLNGIPLELVTVAPNPADPVLVSQVQIDATAADIQPVGTASAAGTVGRAADSGHIHIGASLSQPNTYTGPQTFGDHILSSGNTPTVAAGAALGTTPPAPTVSGATGTRGVVAMGTGTAPAAGVAATVTFARAYAAAPVVLPGAASAATPGVEPYITAVTTTGFEIGFAVAPAASQAAGTYAVSYLVVG